MAIPVIEKRSHWPISVLSSVSSLINVLLPLALVRILTPEEVGTFKIFFLYLMILPAFSFTSGVVNGLSYWAGKEDKKLQAVRVSSVLVLISAFFFFALTWVLRAPLAEFVQWPVNRVLLLGFGLFGAIASVFFEEAAISLGLIWKGALFNAAFEFARTLVILGVALITRNLSLIFVTHGVMMGIKVLCGYILGHRFGLVRFTWDQPMVREVWKYAFPVSLAWIFGVLINYVDQLVLSAYIPIDQFAFYAIGCLSVPPLIIFEHSVARVLIPQLSSAFSSQQTERAAALFKRAVEELAFLLIPAVVGLMVFSVPIIELLFTHRYHAAARYLPIHALTYLALIIPYDSVPRARGQANWIFRNFMAFSILAIVLCFIFIGPFGAFGALAGSVISKAAMRGYAIWYLRESTSWPLHQFLPLRAIARFFVVSGILAALSLLVRSLFSSELMWFFVCGSIFLVIYLIFTLSWKHRLDRTESPSYRVLMLTQYLGIGGLERMILNLAMKVRASGKWHPSVFVFDHDFKASQETHLVETFEKMEIPVELNRKPPGFSFGSIFRICRNIFRNDIQVVHSHDLGALIYGVGAKLGTLGKVRLVHTQHSFVHLNRKKRYKLYERIFTFFADILVVVSEDTRKTYLDLGVPEDRVRVIGNGVSFPDEPTFDRAQRIHRRKEALAAAPAVSQEDLKTLSHSDDVWFLYMARVHTGKGQDRAIELWNHLEPSLRSKIRLVFVGPETDRGRMQYLSELSKKASDSDRIHFVGPSKNPAIWLESSDVYLSCSEFEGMPLGPIEAIGAGLPLILSKIPGHEILSKVSRQYSLTEPQAGAKQVQELFSEISRGGADFYKKAWLQSESVRSGYSMETMAKKYESIYE